MDLDLPPCRMVSYVPLLVLSKQLARAGAGSLPLSEECGDLWHDQPPLLSVHLPLPDHHRCWLELVPSYRGSSSSADGSSSLHAAGIKTTYGRQ